MCPPPMAAARSEPPLNGTNVASMPTASQKAAAKICAELPGLMPTRSARGFSFPAAISSRRLFHLLPADTAMAAGS